MVDLPVLPVYYQFIMKQTAIIKQLKAIAPGIKIDQPRISRIQKGEIKIPFPLAVVLAELFPEKTIPEWKNATPEEFKQVWKKVV